MIFSTLETIAVVLGMMNILLIIRRSIWNYPFGIAMVSCYAWIFYGAKLYSDALLQLFFFVVQIYGWWVWSRAASDAEDHKIPVLQLSKVNQLAVLGGCLLLTLGWGTMMARMTDAHYPYWDGAIAMISVVAQLLLARRYVENWVLWIIVDILAVGLYWTKALHLTAILYGLFLLLAIVGLIQWWKIHRAQRPQKESEAFR